MILLVGFRIPTDSLSPELDHDVWFHLLVTGGPGVPSQVVEVCI
jgi:hypothetical protein